MGAMTPGSPRGQGEGCTPPIRVRDLHTKERLPIISVKRSLNGCAASLLCIRDIRLRVPVSSLSGFFVPMPPYGMSAIDPSLSMP